MMGSLHPLYDQLINFNFDFDYRIKILILILLSLEAPDRFFAFIKSFLSVNHPREVVLRQRDFKKDLTEIPKGELLDAHIERIRKFWNRAYPSPGNKYPKEGETGNHYYKVGSDEATNNATISVWKNIFAIENSDVWAAAAAAPLDYSVGTLVRTEVPSLAKQEDQHATLHNEFCNQYPARYRYSWFNSLLKIVLLSRTYRRLPIWINVCWEGIRYHMASLIDGMVESCFTDAAYLSQILLGGHFCRLLVFHWLEEGEHGVVTSKVFKKRYPITIRCIGFLLGLASLTAIWTIPCFSAIYYNFHLIINPLYFPVAILHLIQYLFVFACNLLIFVAEGLLFWILPFEHPLFFYRWVQRGFQREVEKYCIHQRFAIDPANDSSVPG